MNRLYTTEQLIAILLFGSSALAVTIAAQALRYRQGAVWRYFVYTMAGMAIWAFSDAMFFTLAGNDAARWLWTTIGYSASMLSIPVIFAFSLYFAQLDHWLTPKTNALLSTPFLLAVVLAVTNRWHGAIWERTISPQALTGAGGHGAYFYIMLPIGYGLVLATIVIFLQSFWRLHAMYRRQAVVLSAAVLLPMASSVIYFTELNPVPGVDLAPAVFPITGLLLLYAMRHLRVLYLRPIYRDAVFQHMREGAVIIDGADRIVDINPAAEHFLAMREPVLGDDAQTALTHAFGLTDALDLSPDAHHLVITPEAPPRYFDLRVAHIDQQPGTRLLVWADITRLQAALASLHAQAQWLAARTQVEAELKHDIDHIVAALKTQVHGALESLEHGRLGVTAAMLAGVNAVTTENLLRRTQHFYAPGLEVTDFFAAIQQYSMRFAELHDLDADIDIAADLEATHLTHAARLQMVRVLQAIFDNVCAHAQARRLTLRIATTPEGIALMVSDDGVGFDPAVTLPGAPSAGFAAMQRRMGMLAGELAIYAAPGLGVTVRALFPAEAANTAHAALRGLHVMLAVGHALTREGLSAMLLDKAMVVDAAAGCQEALLTTAPATPPDLVLLDIDLPGITAPDALLRVRRAWPAAKIAFLVEAQHSALPALLHNGADGYVLKSLRVDAFFDALVQLVSGEVALAPGMATQVLAEFQQQDDDLTRLHALTPRQREILHLMALGLTYDEIARRLDLSERTVRYHVEEIRRRLGLASRREVMHYARRHGLKERT